jgi:hypothetical protein
MRDLMLEPNSLNWWGAVFRAKLMSPYIAHSYAVQLREAYFAALMWGDRWADE